MSINSHAGNRFCCQITCTLNEVEQNLTDALVLWPTGTASSLKIFLQLLPALCWSGPKLLITPWCAWAAL